MSTIKLRTLVLNSDYMPISLWSEYNGRSSLYTIPAQDAICRYLNGTCQVVYWYPRKILTPSRKDLYWPSVIVNPPHKRNNAERNEIRLKKVTLFYRDHCKCSHCGDDLTMSNITYEHVIPKVKGGEHSWENVVASCKECNNKKGDNDPVGKWKPKVKPYKPTYFDILENRKKFPVYIDDPRWADFLPNFANVILNKKDKEYV